jgi:hypothetical protein
VHPAIAPAAANPTLRRKERRSMSLFSKIFDK